MKNVSRALPMSAVERGVDVEPIALDETWMF